MQYLDCFSAINFRKNHYNSDVVLFLSSLVLICRRPTWDVAAGTAWDNAAAYVNIYRRHIVCPRH